MGMMKKYICAVLLLAACSSCRKEGGDEPGPQPDPKPTEYNISGCITGSDGRKLAGVVVSDGLVCTQTDDSGNYYLNSSLEGVDFVIVSTPAGYGAPVQDALPVYYRRLDALQKEDGKYSNVDFTLQKIADPERFTIFFAGDPQPRSSGAGYDKIGYHSLECVDDMCRDFKETAAGILPDRPVYGIILGDVCHNDASLFTTYRGKMKTNGFPSYHVLGNHDHDLNKVGDKESATTFESNFGPCNYSFNLGKLHIVVLDNMIVTSKKRSTNSGEDLADGLRDDIWQWLQNDLKYVDRNTTLMICTHSPMFMCMGQKMRSRGTFTFDGKQMTPHYADVDNLIKDFKKVYAWAGHTHAMYNYVNVDDPRVESHTVSRVTGELWTNEYVTNGTPRGYVIFDYNNGDIKWKFHPIKYQSGKHCMAKQPSYEHRDWDYNNGVAKMKADGKTLDESYQMHVYAPNTYKKDDNLIYANIFMWDEKWGTPKLVFNGASTKMKRYTANTYRYYDYSCYEMQTWYKANNSTLSGADYNVGTANSCTIFTAAVQNPAGAGKNKATVTVEDRFGNTYTSNISW